MVALLLVGVVSAGVGACADAADVEPAASPGATSPSPSVRPDSPTTSPTPSEASPSAPTTDEPGDGEVRAVRILSDLGAEDGPEGAVVSFDAVDLFDADSIELTSDGKERLDALLEVFALLDDAPVQIHGHSDGPGNGEDARVFAHQRAAAVAVYVVDEGLDKERLTVDGIGPSDSQRVEVILPTVELDAARSS